MKRRLLWVALGFLVIAGCVILWLTHDSGTSGKSQPRAEVSSSASAPSLTEANVAMLEKALNSSVKVEQARALVPPSRDDEWQPESILPQGTTLKIERQTFKEDEFTGSVHAKVTGSAQGEFVLYLAKVDETWLIYMTEKVG